MNKQPEITRRTKQKLADAFCELYQQKPLEKISIREITESAGYNRSTFYQYFVDIYDILDCVETDLMNVIRGSVREGNVSVHSPDALSLFFEQNEVRLKAVFGDYGCFHFLERLKKVIVSDPRLDDLQIPDEEMPYYLEFHLSTTLSLFRLWLKRGRDIPQETLFAIIHQVYTKGISIGASTN